MHRSLNLPALFGAVLLLASCSHTTGSQGDLSGSDGTASAALASDLPGTQADDHPAMVKAYQRAQTAPIGQQVTWNNPESGNAGTLIPIREGYAPNGAYCREFRQTLTIGGTQQQGTSKACQQPDGSWKAVP